MSSVSPLTRGPAPGLPACCADCVFWQTLRGDGDARRRDRWGRTVEDEFGAFGRVLHEGGEFRGMLQYGPSAAFPRAQALPAGPPDAAAALITCSYITGDDPVGTCERLLLEALADLKARGIAAAEAFAIAGDAEPSPGLVAGHHTLFDAALLASLGFTVVRSRDPVALMRLELGGLTTDRQGILSRARRTLAGLGPVAGNPAPA